MAYMQPVANGLPPPDGLLSQRYLRENFGRAQIGKYACENGVSAFTRDSNCVPVSSICWLSNAL